jgi:hypothetical protein
MMQAKTRIIATALVAFATTTLHSQPLSLGPQLGYYRTTGTDAGEFMYGVALRARILPAIGVEGSVNADDVVKVQTWPVMVTGLLYPLPMVYGAAGVGWYNETAGSGQGQTERMTQEFGWHFGGGVEIPLGTAAALAGDVRYVFLDYDFNEFPGSGESDSDYVVFTVGLLFRG